MAVVNQSTVVPMTFVDSDGNGVTGLTIVATARLAGSNTTISGTVTERTGGDYDVTLTFLSVGVWQVKGSATVDGIPVVWPETVHVIPAAADPAAIADAIAGIMDQSSAGHDAGTIGYEIHALFKRPVGSG